MPEVRIGSEIKTYPQGTAYAEIAEEYQKNYENDILLVSVNGRLRELHKTLQKDCQMEFITAADTAGYLAYQRSAVFLMMKAFQDVAGRENVKNITVCFSVENGLYVEVEGGVTLGQEQFNTLSNIEITDPSIKEFEKIARKYGVDYAVKKDRSSSPPKYLIFFKGRDADALTAAFTEYTGKKVRKAEKSERPSVLAKLSQFKELVKHAVVDRNKRKELER